MQPAPLYLPADPGTTIVDPGVAYPSGPPGPIIADQYAAPLAPPYGFGQLGTGGPGLLNFGAPGMPLDKPFRIVGGVDLVFVQPFFENNDALFVTESDGVTFQNVRGIDFDYDVQFTPRLWLKGELQNGGGLRIAYWQFDHSAGQEAANAPANGFGRVSTPNRFGNVDISATVPGERLSARSSLNLFAIDLEGVRDAELGNWRLVVSGGLRYAEIEQRYSARLDNVAGALAGEIDFRHDMQAIGPTAAILVERPLPYAFTVFTDTRMALLFGDASSRLNAGENLDLVNPFQETATTSRDDVMFVAETRIGVLWGPRVFRQWYPFVGLALEGQFWDGAGSATTEEGNLGLFGLNVMLGASW
jgi:hypothetical protein